jgi:hypothetical protein
MEKKDRIEIYEEYNLTGALSCSIGSAFAKYHDSHPCYPSIMYYNALLLINYQKAA